MLFGSGKEAELNDKEVEIDVGDIFNALTGIFTYDPADEDPQGDPPGPWDGYSLFTVDLSAVKQSLEDIVAALQQHDPDYDPDETPPEDAVEDLVEENEEQGETIEDLTEQVEHCNECWDEVVATLQKYDPNYDPDAGECPSPEIDKVVGDANGYEFPKDPNGNSPYPDLCDIIGNDNLIDEDLHIEIRAMDLRYPYVPQGYHNVFYGFYDSATGVFIDRASAHQSGIDPDHTDYVTNFRVTDPTTGTYTYDWVYWSYLYNPPIWGWATATYTETSQYLIGYGDPSHTYKVTKNS